ncbi:MAG: hypothetical protein ABIE22_01720 [archaeon]
MADSPCPPESISKQAEDLREECAKHQWVLGERNGGPVDISAAIDDFMDEHYDGWRKHERVDIICPGCTRYEGCERKYRFLKEAY